MQQQMGVFKSKGPSQQKAPPTDAPSLNTGLGTLWVGSCLGKQQVQWKRCLVGGTRVQLGSSRPEYRYRLGKTGVSAYGLQTPESRLTAESVLSALYSAPCS